MSETQLPRNLGLELVRATEAAALSAGRWMGSTRPPPTAPRQKRCMQP